MNIDGGSRSGYKRKLVEDDARVEEDGDDDGEEGGALMKASLDDALETAGVPDNLRTIIEDNVSSFNKLFATKDPSNADKMMQLVNSTRTLLQKLCVDRLNDWYANNRDGRNRRR